MEGDARFRKLFVGSLSYNTSDIGLRDYFLQFGAVSQANVVIDRNGISKCFGFVTFVNLEDASSALQNRFHVIDGRRVNCNLAAFPIRISQPSSSTHPGPRMQFGGAAPLSSSSRFVPYPLPYTNPYMSPNNPIHGPGPMLGAGPIPPVYPYGQTSLWNERGTGNTPVTTLARSNTSKNGPRSIVGLPSVYANGQSSGGNQPSTSNNNPNYSMYDSGSLQDLHGLPLDFPYDQPSGSNGPANDNSNTMYYYPMYYPGSLQDLHGLPSVFPYEYDQPSGSNQPVTSNNPMQPVNPYRQASIGYMSPNNPIHGPGTMQGVGQMHGVGPIPPVYPHGQRTLWNERGTGNTSVTTLATTRNTSQNGRPMLMYGPISMTGLRPVYEIGQSSCSNGAATDNSNTMVHFRSLNYPMYDPGSLQDLHGLPSDFPYEYDQPPRRNEPSGTGYFHPVTSQNDADRRRGPIRRKRRNRK